jgi:hypothetical protein
MKYYEEKIQERKFRELTMGSSVDKNVKSPSAMSIISSLNQLISNYQVVEEKSRKEKHILQNTFSLKNLLKNFSQKLKESENESLIEAD